MTATGPRVLITAGASGIGLAMGHAFAATGARVCVTDVDRQALSHVPAAWRAEEVDVSRDDEMRGLFAELEADWGGLDVLCANAGIAGPTAALEDVAWRDWSRCVDVTLGGVFLSLKYAAPLMKAQGKGAIIVTSSTAGQYGYPNRAPYAAAKWGAIGLMKTAAMELGPFGIRANAICPGAVDGPRMEGVIAREAAAKGVDAQVIRDGYALGTSMRTFVSAEDIAAMTVFLASDGAARVSGQVIAVDGHTENPDPKP